jgi:hypothetical protein
MAASGMPFVCSRYADARTRATAVNATMIIGGVIQTSKYHFSNGQENFIDQNQLLTRRSRQRWRYQVGRALAQSPGPWRVPARVAQPEAPSRGRAALECRCHMSQAHSSGDFRKETAIDAGE